MRKRAFIAVKTAKHQYTGIFLSSGGEVGNAGKILSEYYNSAAKALELIALGDLSILDIKTKPDEGEIHNIAHRQEGVCYAYGRDFGEYTHTHTAKDIGGLVETAGELWVAYIYLFEKGKWSVSDVRRQKDISCFSPVQQALEDAEAIQLCY